MSDEIIDFNEIKNKVRDKDIDKFESYIFSLYDSMARGEINMGELSKSITDYMTENNISQEKFYNIQKEMLKRYGFDSSTMESQLKALGIDTSSLNLDMNLDKSYESFRKIEGFNEKYKDRLKTEVISSYIIKNNVNDIKIEYMDENVRIVSEKKIDLNDNELNEFLCSYKKLLDNKDINVSMFENVTNYKY